MYVGLQTVFAGLQWPDVKRPNACVTLQTTDVSLHMPFVPLHTLAASVHTTDVRLRTQCVTLQTTIVAGIGARRIRDRTTSDYLRSRSSLSTPLT
jgi:hypothetical protein